MPAVIVGTSSDRIGTPAGQSFYATASKNLKRETKLPIAPYFGLAYGTYHDSLRMIGGINVGLTESLGSMVTSMGSTSTRRQTSGTGGTCSRSCLCGAGNPG